MRTAVVAIVASLMLSATAGAASRVKDIADVQGIRDNQLVGYGLVIGLAGTGDTLRNAPFTEQSVRSMLQRLGVGIQPSSARSRNVAAVVVTATIPPFISTGERIDVTVSSLGDAVSLAGGTLVMTPLSAADGHAYAVAQGQVTVTGVGSEGRSERLTEGVPTGGRIANGALIERDLTADFNDTPKLGLKIRNPDFATAANVADAINGFARRVYGTAIAAELDFRTVQVERPEGVTASRLMALIGELDVEVSTPARVVINEKTGTIVIGSDVRISPVAITHGNVSVRVTESATVSQPEPLSAGQTVTVPATTINAEEQGDPVGILRGPSLEDLVHGLNRLGLKPQGIIAILQAIKTSGALQAELVIQ